MTSKTFATVALAAMTIAIVLAALLCNAFAQQPPAKLIPNAGEAKPLLSVGNIVGRYQITGLSGNGDFVLLDTHTGQCWLKPASRPWQDLGSPVKAAE